MWEASRKPGSKPYMKRSNFDVPHPCYGLLPRHGDWLQPWSSPLYLRAILATTMPLAVDPGVAACTLPKMRRHSLAALRTPDGPSAVQWVENLTALPFMAMLAYKHGR
eukprot:10441147-Karenia_brevis.AAC.1